MTEKRYFINSLQNIEDKVSGVIFCDVSQITDQLNEYDERFYQLFAEHSELQVKNKRLKQENEYLKEALEELKEIGDYQAMRIQEYDMIEDKIDEKIAVLTDAKIKSFQNEDEELFGKVKFGIQVLRELKEAM